MATLIHIELDALRRGLPVMLAGREIGQVEDVIPQPDGHHVLRLITRRASDGRLIAIPVEWVRDVRDGRIDLVVTQAEVDQLPEYIPSIPASEAREQVQEALDQHPATAGAGIRVVERDGLLELRGRVPDDAARSSASQIARNVPGLGPVRNLLSTAGGPEMSAAGYAYPWLHTLLERVTQLDFDDEQIARIEDIAERKLVDLFDVAEDAALANGRAHVQRQDVPLTRGLQLVLLEVEDLAREFQLEPLLVFLADAGIRAPLDESLRSEIPRLMAMLLILTGHIVAVLELPDKNAPRTRLSRRTLDAAESVLDLTL
jgi:hypothetical protein